MKKCKALILGHAVVSEYTYIKKTDLLLDGKMGSGKGNFGDQIENADIGVTSSFDSKIASLSFFPLGTPALMFGCASFA